MKPRKPHPDIASPESPGPHFRSGAVARMADMPVATLRVWEQRYAAVQPATAPSGQRMYSPADVQRVLLLRQLTERGHAIGSIASLDSARLQQLAHPASSAAEGKARSGERQRARPPRTLRIAVVGPALAARLQRPAVARQLAYAVPNVVAYESLADAAAANAAADCDLLIWHAPELQPRLPPALHAAREAVGDGRLAVVYRFAGSAALQALAAARARAVREPADDHALGAWLASTAASLARRGAKPRVPEAPRARPSTGAVAPRRFDDAALTAIAGLSPTLACECPRHVAELLMLLSSFEAYSAGCISRDTADAQLHAYLQQVAGTARSLFEAALERVARHEGLPLG